MTSKEASAEASTLPKAGDATVGHAVGDGANVPFGTFASSANVPPGKVSAKMGTFVSPTSANNAEQIPQIATSTDAMHKMILATLQQNHAESLRCMYMMSTIACVMFALLFRKLEQQEYRLQYLSKYS